ncbi:hypothetical protein GCM10028864_14730 [Microlunatus parietis]
MADALLQARVEADAHASELGKLLPPQDPAPGTRRSVISGDKPTCSGESRSRRLRRSPPNSLCAVVTTSSSMPSAKRPRLPL